VVRETLLLLALAAVAAPGEDVHVHILKQDVIAERFGRLTARNPDRANVLRTLFANADCRNEHFVEQPVKGSKLPNLVCTLPGTSGQTVTVTAHYDKASLGEGAIDNWSGAALLPSLYQSLSSSSRSLSFVFVLFTDEEIGLVGSRAYVRQLTREQQRTITAEVNIDSIGLPGAIAIWANRADKRLVNLAANTAIALKLMLRGVDVDRVGDSDSHPFKEKNIPVIDFHSITQQTLPLLHSAKDVRGAVDPQTYYDTYRLIATFLGLLDAKAAGSQ